MTMVTEKVNPSFTAPEARPKWSRSWDFIFTAAGCSIGLGNIWRFPYLCFKMGGGAFLLPYLLFAFLIGIPLVLLETSLGQSLRLGLTKTWATVPILKGISLANIMIMMHANVFYVVILAWAMKYIVNSFSSPLPWASCDNQWNTVRCVAAASKGVKNSSLGLSSTANHPLPNASDFLLPQFDNSTSSVSSASEYWNLETLGISSGIEEMGNMRWDLAIYVVVLWILVYLCTFKGIKWSAKIVYVTATLPIVLILVILVRGSTLDGASEGIRYYLTPDMAKLKHAEVWVSAGTQVIYSYGACGGNLITLGSYNDYHHDVYRDSILIGVLNILTSFISGLAVFSTLGFMAQYQNTTVADVAQSGPGLVFVVYPETLSLLPLPQFWCVVFFLTILFLGFDSQFVYQECILAYFTDNFPRIKQYKYGREIFQAIFCFIMMTIGLFMVTEGGVYFFEIYNNFAVAGWCQFLIATCEFVAVGWLIGADRHWAEIKRMIGSRRGKHLIILTWKYIGPAACFALSIYYMAELKPLTYNKYVYPIWAQVLCQIISLSSIGLIPAYAIYKVAVTLWQGKNISELRYRPHESKIPVDEGQNMLPMVDSTARSYLETTT